MEARLQAYSESGDQNCECWWSVSGLRTSSRTNLGCSDASRDAIPTDAAVLAGAPGG